MKVHTLLLCLFLLVIYFAIIGCMSSFSHIVHGCFIGIRATLRSSHFQWNNPEGMWMNSAGTKSQARTHANKNTTKLQQRAYWMRWTIFMENGSFNTLWPDDTLWRRRSGSTFAQVMACCQTVPSHCLNLAFIWWRFMKNIWWYKSVKRDWKLHF